MDTRHLSEPGGPSGPCQETDQRMRRRRGWRHAALLLAAGLALGLAPAGLAHAASGDCATSGGEVTCTYSYSYTGSEQTFTVPAGVTALSVTAVGGHGAAGYNGYNPAGVGGAGGVVTAVIPVTPAEALYVEVGGNGAGRDGFYRGGFNGGGNAGSGAGAGGGASDLRTCSSAATSCATADDSLDSRLLVAAGGGGAGGFTYGGSGGPAGQPGSTGGALYCGFTPGSGGAAGTPTGGGSGGAAGSAPAGYNAYPGQDGALGAGGSASPNSVVGGGGGGAGYYGGGAGGGAVSCAGGGGGGGSNLVPAGGTSGLDTTGTPEVVITYALPVAATTTTLVSTSNPSVYGQSVTLTAAVAGTPGITPTGTITFADGATTLGTATLDDTGTATFSISSLVAGGHSLTAVYGGDATDTGSASAPLTQQVGPAPLTITATDQSMTYGGSVPAFDASYSGFIDGDTSSVVSGLVCGATDSNGNPVSSSTSAGTYAITCSGGSAANYAISYGAGTLTIGPAPLSVTATDQSVTYGSGLPAFDASYSGFVNGDSAASLSSAPTCTTSATGSSPVGSYPITCAGAVDPNYSISYQPGTLTITPAALTIAANDQTMAYGGPVPSFDASYSGLVNGDSSSVVSGLTCNAADGSGNPVGSSTPVGTYPITCTGASAANYAISYTGGTLTITQVSQAISFGALPNHTLGDAPFTVAATGGASGNPVTFSSGPSSVCTSGGANGATIALVGVGTCTVTATQAGNANYQAAPSVSQSFAVSYPPLSLALDLSSSPSGPITTGSVVTATMTLGNHTSAAQTVGLKVTLAYTGSHGSLKITVPLTLKLSAGQTLSRSAHFTIQSWFPRGTYTLSAAATDGSGDMANSSASLTVS